MRSNMQNRFNTTLEIIYIENAQLKFEKGYNDTEKVL